MKALLFLGSIALLLSCGDKKPEVEAEVKPEEFVPCAYCDLIQPQLESMNMPRPVDSYDYPVYPGMEEWASFTTGEAMADACQVPAAVLEKQSTQAVIQAIWEYPLLLDVFHRHQYQADFNSSFSRNNAYLELCTRDDAVTCLYERLERFNPEILHVDLASGILELIISQPVFLSQLSEDAKKSLIRLVLNKYKAEQENEAATDRLFGDVSFLLIGRILEDVRYAPFTEEIKRNEDLRLFLESNSLVVVDRQLILGFAEEYVGKH